MSVRPKKRLGQHFLVDDEVVRAIVDAVAAPEVGAAGAPLVEIGPGEGALTGALLRHFPDLVALDLDAESIAHLRRRFPRLDVRHADVLDADWHELRKDVSRRSVVTYDVAPQLHVVGNLPYYITSLILFSLLDARRDVARAVVMVQEEVAQRLASPPGSKVYGTLSVYFALFARTRYLFGVPPRAFRPPPKVDSAVVEIDFRVGPPPVAFAALQRVVRAAFGQRRKMLRNSLGPLARAAGRELPPELATARPEAVSPADFVRLSQLLDPA